MKIASFKHFFDDLIRDLTTFGGSLFYFILLVLVFVLQELVIFWQLLFSLIFSMLIVVLIRLVYFKPRPNKQDYKNIIEKIDASSFPSWHTARAFIIAFVFIVFFKSNDMTIFLLVMACLVSYSRIYLKKHDYYDLFGGLVLAGLTFYLSTLIF